jgi:hypothetical protein
MSLVGQTRSFGDVGSMSGLPESGHGWAIHEYATVVRRGSSRIPTMYFLKNSKMVTPYAYIPGQSRLALVSRNLADYRIP